MNDHDPAADGDDARIRRRLKSFALHLTAYFITIVGCAALNYLKTPDQLWFIYPMVAWGAPLALHAAWVMGLFDGVTRKN